MAVEGSGSREIDMNKNEEWDSRATEARLVAAYERGGIAHVAEVAVRELEAELEVERRKRQNRDLVEGPR